MIELRILNGKMAGQTVEARHFPFSIGRAPDCDLCLLEDGIWDRHAELTLRDDNHILIRAAAPGGMEVDQEPLKEAVLKIGTILRLGGVRIECWTSPMKQYDPRWREYALWIGAALLMLAELAIIYLLFL